MLSILSKEWNIKEICNNDKVNYLMEELNIGSIMSKFLLSRGFITPEKANEFIHTDDLEFLDPFMLKDMDIAVKHILDAIKKNKKILIYGDYDVDGVTSVSLLYLFFRTFTENIYYYIPNRMDEGYGLSIDSIDQIHENINPDLIITVDCGISSHYEAEYIYNLGINLIITDHHECPELLPKAIAVLNPGREGSLYLNKRLAGVGVALKLVHGIGIKINKPDIFKEYLDMAVIGTIADLAEITEENRLIAKKGLEKINESPRKGIKELIKVSGLYGKEIKSYHIGFLLGPRINAAGRLENAKKAVEMLITDNEKVAYEIAIELDKNNIQRQDCQSEILENVIKTIEDNNYNSTDRILVIEGEDWHQGVIGIVSSKITEIYYKPSLVISTHNNDAKGSGRSVEGFNLYDALENCKDIFTKFGGHKMAAGFSLNTVDIEKLRKTVNEYAEENLNDELLIPKLNIDTILHIDEVNVDTIEELTLLEPFGIGNPAPVFCIEKLGIVNIKRMGKKSEHIRLDLKDKNINMEAIGFNLSDKIRDLAKGDIIDIAFSLSVNNWQGNKKPQLIVKDLKKSDNISIRNKILIKKNKKVDFILNNMDNNTNIIKNLNEIDIFIEHLLITRNDLVIVYKYICKKFNKGLMIKSIDELAEIFEDKFKIDINYFKIRFSLIVFNELGIVEYDEFIGDSININKVNSNKKYKLEDSKTYQRIQTIKKLLEDN